MKVLWLTLESNKEACYGLTERLAQLFELKSVWLSPKQAKHIAKTVGGPELKSCDRVVVQLPLPLLLKQAAYLRCIPHLLLVQPDLPNAAESGSAEADKFFKLMDQMPWCRVLVPAGFGTDMLDKRNIDHGVVPIGFNGLWFKDKGDERSLHAAIVADLEDPDSKARRGLLFDIKTQNKLQIYDVSAGKELAEQLNKMSIAICSDQDCAGYRALNFQAMACGAALMTWDRGPEENAANGFEDMVNVMLYRDAKSAQAKLNFLKRHPEELNSIRESGKALAAEQHSNRALAQKLSDYLLKPLKPFAGDDIEDALRFKFF